MFFFNSKKQKAKKVPPNFAEEPPYFAEEPPYFAEELPYFAQEPLKFPEEPPYEILEGSLLLRNLTSYSLTVRFCTPDTESEKRMAGRQRRRIRNN